MTEFEARVLADLAVLKTQMKEIVGNGQPGRLSMAEERIFGHEKELQRAKGIVAAFAGLVTVIHVAIDYALLRRH